MASKIVVVFVLACAFYLGVANAVVVRHGVLQVVFSDIRAVIIDQTRYQILDDTKIYRESNPDDEISLSSALEGSKVRFDSRDGDVSPVLVYIAIID